MTVLFTPSSPMIISIPSFKFTDPSDNIKGTSLIYIAVYLGSILFSSADLDPPKEVLITLDTQRVMKTTSIGDGNIFDYLLGPKNYNPLIIEQVGNPRLSKDQILQAFTVIQADY